MRRTKQPKSEHDHEAEILAARYAQSRDDADFRRLYRCMEVTVENEAKDSAAGDRGLQTELLAVAMRALAYAAQTWDAARGRKFVTWAKVCIRSRMVDQARWRKRHPGQSIDPEDDESVEEYIDRNSMDGGAEEDQVDSVDASIRLALVKAAWSRDARLIDVDDRELFEAYVCALVDGKRLPKSVGYLILSRALAKGQMLLFAHEMGQVALRDDAVNRAKVMFDEDGWLAATLLLQGETLREVAVDLSLPAELVKAMLDCVRASAEAAFEPEEEILAA